ncbi:MAG: hypothetical protein H6889_07380 [Brucellaceae bacterium]|nr:hypothetical protein [Notoacmeibacter sp.]MCC0026795.1 hypothetical protein [Brucellaceae bacterium]
MSEVERDGDGFVVDAAVLASGFRLPVEEIRSLMREGRITSKTEAGEGEDQRRWRITFYHEERAFRVVLNPDNTIRSRGTFPVPGRSSPNRSVRTDT